MGGGSFDITKTRIVKDPDADFLFSQLFDYVKRVRGVTEKAGDTVKIYFGGLEGDSYFEFNDTTKKLSLYLDGDLKGEWNA